MSVEAECYRAKVKLQAESISSRDHPFEIESLRIVSNEPQRAKDYTVPFKQERE